MKDNIILLPPREELTHVYAQIPEEGKRRIEIFSDLGLRVLEHSDQIKKMTSELNGETYENE